jgi:hypothetical protein
MTVIQNTPVLLVFFVAVWMCLELSLCPPFAFPTAVGRVADNGVIFSRGMPLLRLAPDNRWTLERTQGTRPGFGSGPKLETGI